VNLSFYSLICALPASVASGKSKTETSCSSLYDSTCVFKSLLGVAVKAAVTRSGITKEPESKKELKDVLAEVKAFLSTEENKQSFYDGLIESGFV
jgi:hypothetical protein